MLILVIALSGCATILEDDRLTESLHPVMQPERPPEEQIEVSNYDELKTELLNFVVQHVNTGRIYATNYDGDVTADAQVACREILNYDPIGTYALLDISCHATRIVSYYEVDVNIDYKRTKQQIESIVNVSTLRYLRTELLNVMSDYREEAVIRTTLNITTEDIIALVRETFYQNPRRTVMMPVMAVETFPVSGNDKIYELRFGYVERASILRQHGANLERYVRRNAELAVGENDAEILLSLIENLTAASIYDAGTARTISVHGAQNFAATAFGALVNGSAVGEGFAMAFKALCDELGFECIVVLGHLDGMIHAWNIVSLYGDHYHIDVAMCSVDGIESAFLKTDADFVERYSWNMEGTISCKGTLTYEDIVGTEEEAESQGEEAGGEAGQNGDTQETPDDSDGETEETPDEPATEPDEPEETEET